MQVTLLIVFLAGLVLLNYRIERSVLYPPFIFTTMWLMVFCIYQADLIEIDPLHRGTLLLVGAGALLFTGGGLLAESIPKGIIHVHLALGPFSAKPKRNTWIKYLLTAICLLGMLLIIKQTIANGAGATTGSVLQAARSAGMAGETDAAGYNPLSVYTPIWSTLLATLFLLERKNKLFWLMAGIAFTASLFTTGRGPIILLFSTLLAAYLLQSRHLTFLAALKFGRVPVAIALSLYVLLIFTNKDTSGLQTGVLGVILYFVVGYFVGPIAAMDYVLQHPGLYASEPHHTFKFFLNVATKLHLLAFEPPPLLDKFVAVPFPSNVYTGFKFYYTDFGIVGCLAAVTLIGFIHSLIYRKAATGSELGIFLYSATMFPAIMFIFDDLYSAFGEHLDTLLVGVLYLSMRSLFVNPQGVASIPPFRLLPPGMIPRVRLLPSRVSKSR